MIVELTGYLHDPRGIFCYHVSRYTTTKFDAIIEALEFAGDYPHDFSGTITGRVIKWPQ